MSSPGDHVSRDLRENFEQVLARLEELAGWRTNRLRPPVLILGNFDGVETGIRQLARAAPLETEVLAGITVPTLDEMIRIKAWLVVTRNAVRDYVDLCALSEASGGEYPRALSRLDDLYPQTGLGTVSRQLSKQLAEPPPYDLAHGEQRLTRYRDLRPPWDRLAVSGAVLTRHVQRDRQGSRTGRRSVPRGPKGPPARPRPVRAIDEAPSHRGFG